MKMTIVRLGLGVFAIIPPKWDFFFHRAGRQRLKKPTDQGRIGQKKTGEISSSFDNNNYY